jgi:hypothetical protein
MKTFLIISTLAFQSMFVTAQIDSLAGFNREKAKKAAALEDLEGEDLQRYYNTLERHYINNRYGLPFPAFSSPELRPSPASCADDDFESFLPVAVTLSAQLGSWTLTRAVTNSSMTICNLGPCCSFNPSEARIINVPPGGYIDSMIGPVYPVFSVFGTSTLNAAVSASFNPSVNFPMKGDQVVRINSKKVSDWSVEKLTKIMPVTNANSIFTYAFMIVNYGSHNCCEASAFMIKIASLPSGTVIASQNYSVNGVTNTCATPQWIPFYNQFTGAPVTTINPSQIMYTQWNVMSVNLFPYIGTTVVIEITAADCSFGGHFCYAYIDASCGYIEPLVNGMPTYTGCTRPATMSVNTSLNNYTWNGPGGFTSTAASFTTNTPGIYTITSVQTASLPTLTQTVALNFGVAQVNASVSPTTICSGENVTVQATGLASYNWSTGHNTTGFILSPFASTGFTVTGKDSAGCEGTASVAVKVLECLGLSHNDFSPNVQVSPNPNAGEFSLLLTGLAVPANMMIYDLQGNLVCSQKITSPADKIRMEKTKPGVFLFRIDTENNIYRGSFVVE